MIKLSDEQYMFTAIRLARTHLGMTKGNPAVGALIVRDGCIIGRGVTAKGGRPHAETQALNEAGQDARGATAYVTLEPCAHYGHTPPCALALIEAGVARVVVAHPDPDPRVAGKGIEMLKNAGIAVVAGVLKEQAYEGLSAYLTHKMHARPEITLKMAISEDGMIGKMNGEMLSITHEVARSTTHIMRAQSDAIMIGSNTALNDDPELTCRLQGLEHRSPIRIVVDHQLTLPITSKLCQSAHHVPVWVMVGRGYDAQKARHLADLGCEIIECDIEKGRVDLSMMLKLLGEKGVLSVLLEGGAGLTQAFLNAGLIDRVKLFTSTVIIGDGGIVSPISVETMQPEFKLQRISHLGPDMLYEFLKE